MESVGVSENGVGERNSAKVEGFKSESPERNLLDPYDSDMQTILEMKRLTVELATMAGGLKPGK